MHGMLPVGPACRKKTQHRCTNPGIVQTPISEQQANPSTAAGPTTNPRQWDPRGERGETEMNATEATSREQIIQAARLLFRAGVMSHSGHGNMSVRIPEGDRMLLTTGGVIADLSTDQLALVDFAGSVLEGALYPATREIVAMHSGVYQARSDVRAIIHTHSPRVTTFALAKRALPCAYEALLRFGVVDDIPVADWAPRGSDESVRAIVRTLEAHPGIPAVLLANHGLLAFGQDILGAAHLVIAMEEAAELTLEAQTLGGVQPFPPGALEQVRKRLAEFGP